MQAGNIDKIVSSNSRVKSKPSRHGAATNGPNWLSASGEQLVICLIRDNDGIVAFSILLCNGAYQQKSHDPFLLIIGSLVVVRPESLNRAHMNYHGLRTTS